MLHSQVLKSSRRDASNAKRGLRADRTDRAAHVSPLPLEVNRLDQIALAQGIRRGGSALPTAGSRDSWSSTAN